MTLGFCPFLPVLCFSSSLTYYFLDFVGVMLLVLFVCLLLLLLLLFFTKRKAKQNYSSAKLCCRVCFSSTQRLMFWEPCFYPLNVRLARRIYYLIIAMFDCFITCCGVQVSDRGVAPYYTSPVKTESESSSEDRSSGQATVEFLFQLGAEYLARLVLPSLFQLEMQRRKRVSLTGEFVRTFSSTKRDYLLLGPNETKQMKSLSVLKFLKNKNYC